MRTAPDLRYTDRDVREDPMLGELAEQYLRSYGGEFDPLVRAQNMLAMDGALSTIMTRTVLNCMRADGNVASVLPAPRGYVLSAPLTDDRRHAGNVDATRRPSSVQLPSHERRAVTVRMRLRYDFVINLHVQAKWYHEVDQDTVRGVVPARRLEQSDIGRHDRAVDRPCRVRQGPAREPMGAYAAHRPGRSGRRRGQRQRVVPALHARPS